MTEEKNDLILAGKITGPHGIRGGLKIVSFLEDPGNFKLYKKLYINNKEISLEVNFIKKNIVVANIDGMRTRELADVLIGSEIFINKNERPAPAEDEFYYTDLIGLKVIDFSNGKEIGEVIDLKDYGSGDLFELQFKGEKKTRLFPYTKANFPRVDIAGGKIMFTKPEEEFSEDKDEEAEIEMETETETGTAE